jgi:thiol-disulfide isomerase/thioredoxin
MFGRSILLAVSLAAVSSVPLIGVRAGEGDGANRWLDAPGYEAAIEDHGETGGLVFTSSDYQELLLVPDQGALAYLFLLRDMEAAVIPRSDVKVGEEGAVVSPETHPSSLGSFSREGAEITFGSDSLRIRIGPKPDLVGEVTLDSILARKPGYRSMAAEYKPEPGAIAEIRNRNSPAEILVFFGTWCPVCSRRLPLFIKTMEEAANPRIRVRYVAIDEKYSEPEQMIRAYRIHITPSFIVLADSVEVGRIEKKPRVSLEQDLARILGNPK